VTGKIMPLCERGTSTIQTVADAGGSLQIVTTRRSRGTRYPLGGCEPSLAEAIDRTDPGVRRPAARGAVSLLLASSGDTFS